jgi:hypothetical protein
MTNWEFLKKISFERIAGTKDELNTALLIQDRIKELGGESHLEDFEIEYSKNHKASLKVEGKEFIVHAVSFSKNVENLEAELVYAENLNPGNIYEIKDKIALINSRPTTKHYKDLLSSGCLAYIQISNTLYDNLDDDPGEQRKPLRDKYGTLPALTMNIKEAHKLLKYVGKKVKISVYNDIEMVKSHNVVSNIEGAIKDEIIVFSAHYDSVKYSTGAYDNGTGSIALLDIYSHFIKNSHKLKRSLRFVWMGSEERGLLGSKAYVEAHKEELNQIVLNINIDMLGVIVGGDLACVSADNKLVNFIDSLSKYSAYPIHVYSGVYSSDSTPFADTGVPALSFARMPSRGGKAFHSKRDNLDYLDKNVYYRSVDFIIDFSEEIIETMVLPFDREIPENIKTEIDKYFSRDIK